MKWVNLLKKTAQQPVFSSGFVAAGENLSQVRLQLSRWVKDGKLIKIRRGLYVLSEPYRKVNPEPFCLANALKSASYVSLQSALAYYGLIPEFVPVVMSVTTKRPERFDTELGRFEFKHIKKSFFYGFEQIQLSSGQNIFIALPEKALLDLIYLTPDADNPKYLKELRLQETQRFDISLLKKLARKSNRPKLERAIKHFVRLTEL